MKELKPSFSLPVLLYSSLSTPQRGKKKKVTPPFDSLLILICYLYEDHERANTIYEPDKQTLPLARTLQTPQKGSAAVTPPHKPSFPSYIPVRPVPPY